MKLERVERLNLGIGAGAVAASLALATPHFAASLAAGAFLEAVNFGALYRGAERFFAGEFAGAGPWVGLFGIRFIMLGIGIFVTISAGAHPAALLIGLSLAMPAVVIDAWLHRPEIIPADMLPAIDADDPSWDRYSVWLADEAPLREDSSEPGAETTEHSRESEVRNDEEHENAEEAR
jgi:hypothetical protein